MSKQFSVYVGVLACACALNAQAQSEPVAASGTVVSGSDGGFSYFVGLGGQHLRYRETASVVPVKSSATVNSPLIVTGALYVVSPELLFSMDSESTFAPGDTTEQWKATQDVFNGVTLKDRLLQVNGFSLSQNNIQVLGHYRVAGPWFAVAGPSLRTQTFKRYSFEVKNTESGVVAPADHTVEESSSEVVLNVGAALESERVRGQATHYGVRALVGLPVWRRVENTQSPGVKFDGAKGFDLSLEGRYSVELRPAIHLGVWGKWMVVDRKRSVSGSKEVPDNRLDGLNYGVELLWKL